MRHYCTLFDRAYLPRGLALHQSLSEHTTEPFTLWALCFDEDSYNIIVSLWMESLHPIALSDFVRGDPLIGALQETRNPTEFFFSCTAAWCLYLLNHSPEISGVTYLDADLLFFDDPSPIFDELEGASILIIPHRFPSNLKNLEIYGLYNVGLLSFNNDISSRECLHWWRERCIEWCFDRAEDGKFADQKYLDDWPQRFHNVRVLQHEGVNVAPWNAMNYDIHIKDGKIKIDDWPLVLYHFQGIKFLTSWLYDPGVSRYFSMPHDTLKLLYDPYIRYLRQSHRIIKSVGVLNVSPHSAFSSRQYDWRTFIRHLVKSQLEVIWPPFKP
jgi:hypothetical protein